MLVKEAGMKEELVSEMSSSRVLDKKREHEGFRDGDEME